MNTPPRPRRWTLRPFKAGRLTHIEADGPKLSDDEEVMSVADVDRVLTRLEETHHASGPTRPFEKGATVGAVSRTSTYKIVRMELGFE